MKALSIINGVVDEQVHGDIERYAQLLGFLSYEPPGLRLPVQIRQDLKHIRAESVKCTERDVRSF